MIKSLEYKGKNIDAAIEKALNELKLDRDDVSVEVLERQKSGFLGIGAVDARIRVTFDDGMPEPKEEKPVEAPKKVAKPIFNVSQEKLDKIAAEAPKARPAAEKPAEGTAKKTSVPEPRLYMKIPADKSANPVAATPKKVQNDNRGERRSNNDRRRDNAPREKKPAEPFVKLPVSDEAPIPFIIGLLDRMGIEANAEITERREDAVEVALSGPNMGKLIGRHGETMDAIQYISSLAFNRDREGGHTRVIIDTENYREKREQTLTRLARRMAENAIRQNRPVTLEPMSPTERRLIHTALQANEKVTTYSTGVDPMRRVVISPKDCTEAPVPASSSSGRRSRGRRGGRNRHHSGNRQNRPQNAASAPEAQAQDAE